MGVTRKERFLKAMLDDDKSKIPAALSREERLLREIAERACNNDTLREGGGGGSGGGLPTGGEPHQMLVTDAEGNAKWEERTHYSYESKGYVIPEIILSEDDFDSEQGSFFIRHYHTLKDGESYTVNYHGNSYECVAIAFDTGEAILTLMGNTGMLGFGEENEMPFMIMSFNGIDAGGGVYGALYVVDGGMGANFSVEGMIEHVKKLDEKYINSAESLVVVVTEHEDGTLEADTPYANVFRAILAHKNVLYKLNSEVDGTITWAYANGIDREGNIQAMIVQNNNGVSKLVVVKHSVEDIVSADGFVLTK